MDVVRITQALRQQHPGRHHQASKGSASPSSTLVVSSAASPVAAWDGAVSGPAAVHNSQGHAQDHGDRTPPLSSPLSYFSLPNLSSLLPTFASASTSSPVSEVPGVVRL
ncbi:hypothetical protein BGW38_010795 [Lunasporangiospora selenospora]|uniref:Uncharacterized protein n=1 Tax=Lunasporangiospora selenospora TaxID=979761 RepID=A0A9P6KFH1_9FUNG|nr:hypothetical protein BGW38_010795 [Lunasporangiospora selenospora]